MLPPSEVLAFLESFDGIDTATSPNTHYFFYDPHRDTPHDRRQPFATVVSGDDHDAASNLSRPGVYRLNIGVTRATYRTLFGPEPAWNVQGGHVDTGHDFTLLDTILPHPIYAPLSWICILNPSGERWPAVQELVREAHASAKRRHERAREAGAQPASRTSEPI